MASTVPVALLGLSPLVDNIDPAQGEAGMTVLREVPPLVSSQTEGYRWRLDTGRILEKARDPEPAIGCKLVIIPSKLVCYNVVL